MAEEYHTPRWIEARNLLLGFWRLAKDVSPDIVSAFPVEARALEARSIPQGAAVMDKGAHLVLWLGMSRSKGLVHGMSRWIRPSSGDDARRPQPPVEGWQPMSPSGRIDTKGVPGKPYSYLPFPFRSVGAMRGVNLASVVSESEGMVAGQFIDGLGFDAGLLSLADVESWRENERGWRSRNVLSLMNVSNLGWLCGVGAPEGVTAPEASSRRIQMMQAMPVLHRVIRDKDAAMLAVDRGEEVIPALAKAMGCSPALMRALEGFSGDDGSAEAMLVLKERRTVAGDQAAVSFLDTLPVDVVRGMSATMRSGAWEGLASLFRTLGSLPAGFQPFCRSFVSLLRPDPVHGWTWIEERGNRWAHLDDLSKELSDDLFWPAEARANPAARLSDHRVGIHRRSAYVTLLSLGPRRLARLLDAHMAGILRRGAMAHLSADPTHVWPAPAEPWTSSDGLVLRFLTSPEELTREGQALMHCVGGYADSCAGGHSAIMSIGAWSGETWKPGSTVEFRRSSGETIEVVQHYGQRNANPPADHRDALEKWCRLVENGGLAFEYAVLRNVHERDERSIEGRLGADWRSPEAHAARWLRWRRILETRRVSPGDLMMGVPGMLDDVPLANMATMVVDLDTEMDIARQIAAAEGTETLPEGPAP